MPGIGAMPFVSSSLSSFSIRSLITSKPGFSIRMELVLRHDVGEDKSRLEEGRAAGAEAVVGWVAASDAPFRGGNRPAHYRLVVLRLQLVEIQHLLADLDGAFAGDFLELIPELLRFGQLASALQARAAL